MVKYTTYPGKYPCHTCRTVVTNLRHYPEAKKITWLCPDKHMTTVSLETKKSRADYE